MKILISSLVSILAFPLDFGNSSSQGESSQGSHFRSRSRSPSPPRLELSLRPPGQQADKSVFAENSQRGSSRILRSRTLSPLRLQLSLGQPDQPADQNVPDSNTGRNEISGSRSRPAKFRITGHSPRPVQGPANTFLRYKNKRIEVVLDRTGTKIVRADYPGNDVPYGSSYVNNIFLCRQARIGELKFVEYIKHDGSLMGVRAPITTTSNVMEPDETTWFVIYHGKYFKVKQNPQTEKAESISLIPENLQEDGDRSREQIVGGFKFLMFRKYGCISGAALIPEGE